MAQTHAPSAPQASAPHPASTSSGCRQAVRPGGVSGRGDRRVQHATSAGLARSLGIRPPSAVEGQEPHRNEHIKDQQLQQLSGGGDGNVSRWRAWWRRRPCARMNCSAHLEQDAPRGLPSILVFCEERFKPLQYEAGADLPARAVGKHVLLLSRRRRQRRRRQRRRAAAAGGCWVWRPMHWIALQ